MLSCPPTKPPPTWRRRPVPIAKGCCDPRDGSAEQQFVQVVARRGLVIDSPRQVAIYYVIQIIYIRLAIERRT